MNEETLHEKPPTRPTVICVKRAALREDWWTLSGYQVAWDKRACGSHNVPVDSSDQVGVEVGTRQGDASDADGVEGSGRQQRRPHDRRFVRAVVEATQAQQAAVEGQAEGEGVCRQLALPVQHRHDVGGRLGQAQDAVRQLPQEQPRFQRVASKLSESTEAAVCARGHGR